MATTQRMMRRREVHGIVGPADDHLNGDERHGCPTDGKDVAVACARGQQRRRDCKCEAQCDITGGGHGGHRKVKEHHEVVKNFRQADECVVEAALKHLDTGTAGA